MPFLFIQFVSHPLLLSVSPAFFRQQKKHISLTRETLLPHPIWQVSWLSFFLRSAFSNLSFNGICFFVGNTVVVTVPDSNRVPFLLHTDCASPYRDFLLLIYPDFYFWVTKKYIFLTRKTWPWINHGRSPDSASSSKAPSRQYLPVAFCFFVCITVVVTVPVSDRIPFLLHTVCASPWRLIYIFFIVFLFAFLVNPCSLEIVPSCHVKEIDNWYTIAIKLYP